MRPARWILEGLWVGLLIAAVAGTLASTLQVERGYKAYIEPFAALGIRAGEVDNQLRIVGVYGRREAVSATPLGLILSVDGRPAPARYRDRLEVGRMLAKAPGPRVNVRIRSDDGRIRNFALQRSDAWLSGFYAGTGWTRHRLWIESSVSADIVRLVQIFAAILLFTRARRERVAVLLSASFLMMAASGINFPNYVEPLWGPFGLAAPLLGALGLGGVALGMLVFPDGRFDPPWVRWILAPLGAFVIAHALYGYGIVAAGWLLWPLTGLILAAVVVQVWRYRRLPVGEKRQQIRWTLLGAVCAGICIAAAAVVIEWRNHATADPMVIAWLSAVFPVLISVGPVAHMSGLVVSLVRYRLYDVDTIVSRSAAFALVTIVLAAVWAGIERALEVVLEDRIGHEAQAVSVGLAAALAAFLINPLHIRAHRWAEQVFHKALMHLRRDLPLALAELRETASAGALAAAALAPIVEGVHATRGAIALHNGRAFRVEALRGVSQPAVRTWLSSSGPALAGNALVRGKTGDLFPFCLPLTLADGGRRRTVGWLLLGLRPDGSFFGKDELDTLKEVADPLARALQIARLRQSRERAQERKLAALAAEVAAARDAQAKVALELETVRDLLAQRASVVSPAQSISTAVQTLAAGADGQ